MFGYEPHEIEGKNFITEVKTIAVKSVEKMLESIETSNEIPYIVTAIRKDGTRFRAVITGRAMMFQDRLVRAASFLPLSDVTENNDG